jgi:hypothetical protein
MGPHVHKTTYGPLMDWPCTVHNAFDSGKSITWASDRWLGLGNLVYFGLQVFFLLLFKGIFTLFFKDKKS